MKLLSTIGGQDYWIGETQNHVIATKHIDNPDYVDIALDLFGKSEVERMLKNNAIVPTSNRSYIACLNANSNDFAVLDKCYYSLGTSKYKNGETHIHNIVDRINGKFSIVMCQFLTLNHFVNSMSTDQLIYMYCGSDGLIRCKDYWRVSPFDLSTFTDSFIKIVDKDINDIVFFNKKIYIN